MFTFLVSGIAIGQTTKNNKSFQNFPKGADQVEVGTKVSERFLQRPHSSTGFWYTEEQIKKGGLFNHPVGYIVYPDVPIYWGRGNGWMAAGMAELLRDMPETNIYKQRILSGYKKMMATLLKYPDKDVMWHQIVDDPNAWNETSCTGMFTFAFITGVKNGWLDAKIYAPAARKGWIALCSYINAHADVTDICEGTNKKNDYQYYLDRAKRTGDLHGQAPILWCVTAFLR